MYQKYGIIESQNRVDQEVSLVRITVSTRTQRHSHWPPSHHQRALCPLTLYYLRSPASLQVSGGDGSPKGLDKANHSQGGLLHVGGEDAFEQGDLVVPALDDGVIEERIGKIVARGKDDGVDALEHSAVLEHGGRLCELPHVGPDGHSATQDAGRQLVVEDGLLPQGSAWETEAAARTASPLCFVGP